MDGEPVGSSDVLARKLVDSRHRPCQTSLRGKLDRSIVLQHRAQRLLVLKICLADSAVLQMTGDTLRIGSRQPAGHEPRQQPRRFGSTGDAFQVSAHADLRGRARRRL